MFDDIGGCPDCLMSIASCLASMLAAVGQRHYRRDEATRRIMRGIACELDRLQAGEP